MPPSRTSRGAAVPWVQSVTATRRSPEVQRWPWSSVSQVCRGGGTSVTVRRASESLRVSQAGGLGEDVDVDGLSKSTTKKGRGVGGGNTRGSVGKTTKTKPGEPPGLPGDDGGVDGDPGQVVVVLAQSETSITRWVSAWENASSGSKTEPSGSTAVSRPSRSSPRTSPERTVRGQCGSALWSASATQRSSGRVQGLPAAGGPLQRRFLGQHGQQPRPGEVAAGGLDPKATRPRAVTGSVCRPLPPR